MINKILLIVLFFGLTQLFALESLQSDYSESNNKYGQYQGTSQDTQKKKTIWSDPVKEDVKNKVDNILSKSSGNSAKSLSQTYKKQSWQTPIIDDVKNKVHNILESKNQNEAKTFQEHKDYSHEERRNYEVPYQKSIRKVHPVRFHR